MSYKIEEANGKLGVLLPGLGAVATTFIAGCLAMRKGLAEPIGSLTQTGTIRLGKRTEKRSPKIRDFVSLASLDDLVFGGWDIFPENTYEAAMKAGVLDKETLEPIKEEMEAIKPWPAVFDQNYVKRLHGEHVKKGANWMELAEQLMEDMQNFQKEHGLSLAWSWSGAVPQRFSSRRPKLTRALAAFEKAMKDKRSVDRSVHDLRLCRDQARHSLRQRSPQPFRRLPGPRRAGHGNADAGCRKGLQDGTDPDEDHPRSGLQVTLCSGSTVGSRPTSSATATVRSSTTRTRSRRKRSRSCRCSEASSSRICIRNSTASSITRCGSTTIRRAVTTKSPGTTSTSWAGSVIRCQSRINFLCRDSILAAPIVLDLALFLDLAKRSEMRGIQEWLSFYFKSPMCAPDLYPRARPLHSADEAQEHAPSSEGRGADHAPGVGSTTTSSTGSPSW